MKKLSVKETLRSESQTDSGKQSKVDVVRIIGHILDHPEKPGETIPKTNTCSKGPLPERKMDCLSTVSGEETAVGQILKHPFAFLAQSPHQRIKLKVQPRWGKIEKPVS